MRQKKNTNKKNKKYKNKNKNTNKKNKNKKNKNKNTARTNGDEVHLYAAATRRWVQVPTKASENESV